MTIPPDTARKLGSTANNMTYRASSPSTSSTSQFTLDEPTRGRKPMFQPYNVPTSSMQSAAYAAEDDVLTAIDGPARGKVQASTGGDYAYSTTLRRQPSSTFEGPGYAVPSQYHPHRSSSPSPYGRRHSVGEQDASVWQKMVGMGKKAMGKEGYDAVNGEEEEEARRKSIERRARETPSAIYAHKSVDVS